MSDADMIRDTLRFAQDDEAEAALDRLLSELETARRCLTDVRALLDAYSDDDGPGACLVALGKIGDRVYREVTGV